MSLLFLEQKKIFQPYKNLLVKEEEKKENLGRRRLRNPPPWVAIKMNEVWGAYGAPNGFKVFRRVMRIPNKCLVLKLDNGKVVSIPNEQTDRITERPSTVLVYRLSFWTAEHVKEPTVPIFLLVNCIQVCIIPQELSCLFSCWNFLFNFFQFSVKQSFSHLLKGFAWLN